MKWLKKILCYGVAVVIGMAIMLAVFLPMVLGEKKSERRVSTKLATVLAEETGASTADKSKKGGAIFLEESTTYSMKGGTISGSKNTYGGAVFISKGATFTMEGGTITGCSAKYGGAIYIASGGTCIINGGKILNNTAEVAPAIYVESGGKLTIINDPTIADNSVGYYFDIDTSEDKLVVLGGLAQSTIKLPIVNFGMYPKTYVGDSMNATLESWYSGKQVVKTYTCGDKTWSAYTYLDGYMYVRGQAKAQSTTNSVYKDGTLAVTDQYTWFKVEPITWYVLNYEKWKAGEEDLELLSELCIACNIPFYSSSAEQKNWIYSDIREWCNGEFFNSAFEEGEQKLIKTSPIDTRVNDEGTYTTNPDESIKVSDRVYLQNCNDPPLAEEGTRIASGSDFAIANNLYIINSETESLATAYRSDRSAWYYYLYSYTRALMVSRVTHSGSITGGGMMSVPKDYGIRPLLKLDI